MLSTIVWVYMYVRDHSIANIQVANYPQEKNERTLKNSSFLLIISHSAFKGITIPTRTTWSRDAMFTWHHSDVTRKQVPHTAQRWTVYSSGLWRPTPQCTDIVPAPCSGTECATEVGRWRHSIARSRHSENPSSRRGCRLISCRRCRRRGDPGYTCSHGSWCSDLGVKHSVQ